MKKKIVILSGSHLCSNPRVLKEAQALANAGYEVTILGAWFDGSLKERDRELAPLFRFVPVIDFTEGGTLRLAYRIRSRLARLAHRIARVETRWQLGYATCRQHGEALVRNADLYIAHSESAMAVGVDLLRDGHAVGIDFEDWFSEDLTAQARKQRPVRLLRELERNLLSFGIHATCPSRAMSDALSTEFACVPLAVVYNAFQWSERKSIDGLAKDRRDQRLPSIHWFSQTLGHDRGLEDLIAALPFLKQDAEIHLRGNPASGFENWLAQRVPENWRRRIVVHGLVSNSELLSRIAEHDIGFAGEMPTIRSRDLTVTNKILQYLLAGLAVVASDTSGQREVAAQAPGAVWLYRSGDASELAAQLNTLLGSADVLQHSKRAALQAAERTFCWEQQERALLDSVARALASPSAEDRKRLVGSSFTSSSTTNETAAMQ